MREIKFRAWDKLEKRMRKVVSLHWQDDKLVSARLEGENEPILIEGRLVIEQFTGLVARDEEIWENDIVEVTSTYHDYGLGAIFWNDNDLRFGVKLNENPIPSAMYEIDAGRSEVTFVSNIHEDPELVEEK